MEPEKPVTDLTPDLPGRDAGRKSPSGNGGGKWAVDMNWPLTYRYPPTLGEDAEEDLTMSTVDYRFIDADQHTYEPGDCFSRHMEAKFRNRTIEPGSPEPDGHRPFVLDGQRILPNFYHGTMGPGTWQKAGLRSS